jgi:hypothetical protein
VSGVRSSWLTLAKNSLLSRSSWLSLRYDSSIWSLRTFNSWRRRKSSIRRRVLKALAVTQIRVVSEMK